MKSEKLEYRMYGLVPYNLSPIQQGIQFGHAVQEFNNQAIEEFQRSKYESDADKFIADAFHKWRKYDKTFIILNGGTTNNDIVNIDGVLQSKGTLNNHYANLNGNDVYTASFFEPDLGDQLTAVVFLVDERVYDKKKYPDFKEYLESIPTDDRLVSIDTMFENYWRPKWIESLGGEKNVWLREFLSQFKLA